MGRVHLENLARHLPSPAGAVLEPAHEFRICSMILRTRKHRTWGNLPPMNWPGDATALADDLRRSLRGEVRFDTGHRALYATDASNYRQVPAPAWPGSAATWRW